MREYLTLLVFCILTRPIVSQTRFHSPLDIPLSLSANFCELRPNHFHMGIDLRTNGVEGLRIYAIDSGFVSRIKCSPFGYGKVIYIDHPSGLTSVYAHCSKFIGLIDSLISAEQKRQQKFEVELLLKPTDIPLKRGELIALSGNTGHSFAPHLHFEIRDTKSENALNPLSFFDLKDTKKPVIQSIRFQAITKEGYLANQTPLVFKVSALQNQTITIPPSHQIIEGGIGLEFSAEDWLDAASSTIAIYKAILLCDGDTLFAQINDTVSFDHTRMINSHNPTGNYQRAFKVKHNHLENLKQPFSGLITLEPNMKKKIRLECFDIKGNSTHLEFTISCDSSLSQRQITFPSEQYFYPDSSYNLHGSNHIFHLPVGSFYEPTMKQIDTISNLRITKFYRKIDTLASIELKSSNAYFFQKQYIRLLNGTKGSALKTEHLTNGWLRAESKELGTFKLAIDTIAPSVRPINFQAGKEGPANKRIRWKVSDDQTEILDYDCYLDDHWILLEYDDKEKTLFAKLPNDIQGSHTIRIEVTDSLGNKRVETYEILY